MKKILITRYHHINWGHLSNSNLIAAHKNADDLWTAVGTTALDTSRLRLSIQHTHQAYKFSHKNFVTFQA